MKIDLTNLFNGSEKSRDIDYSLDMSDLLYSSYNPLKKPVLAKGRVFSKADVVYLELNVSYVINGVCDRCAEDVVKNYSFDINKILVEQLQNDDDDDDYIVIQNHILDLNELVNEEVSLSLPSKLLCKDDCKGLCYKCGANLNVKKCDCKADVDPRMAALLQLLDEE